MIRVALPTPSQYQIRHMFNLNFAAIRTMNGRVVEVGRAGFRGYRPREFLDGMLMRERPFLMTRYWKERQRWREGALSKKARTGLLGPYSMQSWMDRQ